MHASRFLCRAALVMAAVLTVPPAHAAKQPRGRPISGPIQINGIPPDTLCIVGPDGIMNESVDLFEPQFAPDRYFVRLDSSTECDTCATSRFVPRYINVVMNHRCTCDQRMYFRFVAGKWENGKYKPDPTRPLTEPLLNYSLFAVAPLPCLSTNVYMVQHVLQLPDYFTDTLSCLPRDAFIEAQVLENAPGCNVEGLLVEWTFDSLAVCPPNYYWNFYADEEGNHEDDMCIQKLPTPIAMWVDGVCCAIVPTRKTTWGNVRRLYHQR